MKSKNELIEKWWASLNGENRLEIADKYFKSYLLPFSWKTIVRMYNLENKI